eukprot:gene2729-1714_t
MCYLLMICYSSVFTMHFEYGLVNRRMFCFCGVLDLQVVELTRVVMHYVLKYATIIRSGVHVLFSVAKLIILLYVVIVIGMISLIVFIFLVYVVHVMFATYRHY